MKADASVVEFARCFLRLADLPNFALDRLRRYEPTPASTRTMAILVDHLQTDTFSPVPERRIVLAGKESISTKVC
jgi:hypothetical protein